MARAAAGYPGTVPPCYKRLPSAARTRRARPRTHLQIRIHRFIMKQLTSLLAPAAALACLAGVSTAQTINEIRTDQPGADNDEYVELLGVPAMSLDGLAYIVIGDGSAALGSGVVESVTVFGPADVFTTSTFVLAETTFTLGTADLSLGSSGLNLENGDNVTHLLVSGWTGSNGADLDADDDGVIDAPAPWAAIIDSVAVLQSTTSGDLVYSTTTVGPDGTFVPGHAYRCGEWRVGNFDPIGGDDTPNADNNCGPDSFCFGINALCPCANGGSGLGGCENPQTTGGVVLSVSSFTPDGLGGGTAQFDGTGYGAATAPTVVLIRSTSSAQPTAFGDGILCLAAPVTRIQATAASTGTSTMSISHGAGPGSFVYQNWYRSLPGGFCTADPYNTSNGVVIDW